MHVTVQIACPIPSTIVGSLEWEMVLTEVRQIARLRVNLRKHNASRKKGFGSDCLPTAEFVALRTH